MILSEIKYTSEQSKFLQYLAEIGGVLQTVILKIDGLPDDVYSISKMAAKKGMEILAVEAKDRGYLNTWSIVKEDLVGTEINFKDFIGEGYDFENRKMNLFSYNYDAKVIYSEVERGFAKALLVPPHSLHSKNQAEFASIAYEEIENLFLTETLESYLKIILQAHNNFNPNDLKIISWSDNWSTYFNDGKEWWGTFCWTVYDSRNNTVVFIAASSTD